MTHRLLMICVVAVAGSCSDGADPIEAECSFDNPTYFEVPGCLSGMRLALRYGDDVLLQPEEWNRYYRLMSTLYAHSPLTQLATPTGAGAKRNVFVHSRHQPIIDAWTNGTVATGDPQVDAVFDGNATAVFDRGLALDEVTHVYEIVFPVEASVDVLARLVATIPDTEVTPPVRPHNDTQVEWSGEVATVDLAGGWQDCFAGCQYYHYWTATVDVSTETVEVQDLGGDVIPDWIYEAFGLPVP